jgi:hypothetical protein
MLCETKTELLVAYQKASFAYSQGVAELARYAGTIPRVEYEKLRLSAERARRLCSEARDALQVHTLEHNC